MGSQPPTLSLSVVRRINSDFKNHLVLLSLPLENWTSLEVIMLWKDVFECSAALLGKRIAVTTTDNGISNIKGMRDGGIEDGLVLLLAC